MKKSLSLIACAFLAFGSSAQLAKRYVLFEHFTQASCGPCAAQNPGFQNTILANNADDVHHIAFHTSWPGVDPMNAHNKTQVASRVSYYGVSGVPNVIMDGVNKGGPGAINQQMVDELLVLGSPVKIDVTQVLGTDDNFVITVKVTSVGTPPEGNFKLLTALVEKDIVYSTPPGSNGEKDFPNVFRKMASADNGDDITLPAKGQSVEFTYTVPNNSVWIEDQIYSIAYIQGDDQNIINSGASLDNPSGVTYGFLGIPDKLLAAGTPGSSTNFTMQAQNTGSNAENYRLSLLKDAPADWNVSVTINGTTITDNAVVNIPAGATYDAVLSVTPGTSSYVGDFTVSFVSEDDPATINFMRTVQVISNVTDLIVSSTGSAGNFTSAEAFEPVYRNGLISSGRQTFASTDSRFLESAINEAAMTGVRNVYFNYAWSFDILTPGMISALTSFINNGGNLFLAGQDIAWESNAQTGNSYFTPEKQAFFRDVLKIGYVSDNANSFVIYAEAAEYFSSMGTSTIKNNFYGAASSTYFPDQISIPAGSPAIPVFYYTPNKTKIAGARIADNVKKSKIVYMGIGPEQLADTAKKSLLIKLAHDYFYSTVGINKNNQENSEMLGECYPNPASGFVTFTFGNLQEDMTLRIVDLTGKEVYTQPVWSDMDKTSVNVSAMASGIYFYQLVGESGVVASRKLTVTK